MNMKQHILSALREKKGDWELLLAGLSEAQRLAPLAPSHWTLKDNLVHLWAWQQRTLARCTAALADREPEFPPWPSIQNADTAGSVDALNAWIYETNRDLPWETVYQNWQTGFARILEVAEQISERDLLDAGRYAWLGGYSIGYFLLATYDHHQEHYEAWFAWLKEQGES